MTKDTKTTRQMLKVLIDDYGFSVADIAYRAKTTPWSVTRWYSGDTKRPMHFYVDAVKRIFDEEQSARRENSEGQ